MSQISSAQIKAVVNEKKNLEKAIAKCVQTLIDDFSDKTGLCPDDCSVHFIDVTPPGGPQKKIAHVNVQLLIN